MASAQTRPTFATEFDPRKNAFCLLRFLLASGVILSHSFFMGTRTGVEPMAVATHGLFPLGLICVKLFFLVSGFLVTRSYLLLQSPGRFLWHRAMRILPGFWVCLLVVALVMAPAMVAIQGQDPRIMFKVRMDHPLTYIINNWFVIIHQQRIAGSTVFAPRPGAIDGPLWSLSYETAAYLVVAAVGFLGILRSHRALALGTFGALLFLHIFSYLRPALYHPCFPDFPYFAVAIFAYFAAGVNAYLFREKIPCGPGWFALSLVAIVVAVPTGFLPLVWPFALSYATLWLAFKLPASGFERFGDFSYGLYIYGSPVQIMLALAHLPKYGNTLYFMVTLLITLGLAGLSYRFVEAPALRLKSFDFARLGLPWRRKPVAGFAPEAVSEDPPVR